MKTFLCIAACALVAGATATQDPVMTQPSAIFVDGAPSATRVTIADDGTITLNGGKASRVRLVWSANFNPKSRALGGDWERTYGDSEWLPIGESRQLHQGYMPWYTLVNDGVRTVGYGVMVQPNAFAAWKVFADRLELHLDVRAGSEPVELGSRNLDMCRLVWHRGTVERAFKVGRELCRKMCPSPRLPRAPVYGYNDWYCAYGNNTATNFLADAAYLIALMDGAEGPRVTNRPFVVVDDGWQFARPLEPCEPGRRWAGPNAQWGMAMDEFARRVRAMDAHPGLWYRPFVSAGGCRVGAIDPTDPKWARQILGEMARFADWGMELVKIDFITYEWNQTWGMELADSPVATALPRWSDCSRTTAEVVKGLYRTMREAAGERMYIIGCNAIDHFASGLFELQRIGDDTSGREWARTRKMGPNTLGMRAMHNGVFYQCDGDCVGLVKAGDVPWSLNRQWLELVGRSGTSLFVSWKRSLATDPDIKSMLAKMWRVNSERHETAEPLDWMETPRPQRWRFDTGITEFDWQ